MNSRGRPKKSGNARIDGAIDAMRPLGFPAKLVRETVKGLLKVYGENGWYFLEDNGYQVLLEALIEKQTDGAQKKDSSQDGARIGDGIKTSAAEPSSGVMEPTCSNPESTYAINQANETSDMPQTLDALNTTSLINELDSKECLPQGEGTGRKDTKLDQHSRNKQMDNVNRNSDKDSCGDEHRGNMVICPLPVVYSPQPVNGLPSSRRRPYHGWISDDEQDFVHLTPAPLPKDIAKMLTRTDRQRKCKTRWDVRPEDM